MIKKTNTEPKSEVRVCPTCKVEKPFTPENFFISSKTGKLYKSYCRECYMKYLSGWFKTSKSKTASSHRTSGKKHKKAPKITSDEKLPTPPTFPDKVALE